MSKLSAYEKRQAVYNKISQDIYNNRLKRLQETAQQEQAEANQNKHWLERSFETVGDFFGNVIAGGAKALEGIYDFGASIVGGVGGIFDQGFQDRVKEHIAYDWTTENFSNPINDYFSGSYLNDGDVGRFIENVASGVGQMLPSVAMNIVAPGSGMVTLGLSATGSGTEEAFKDGAGYYQGMGYGALSGAVEMATEKLGAKLFGTSAIDDALGIKSGKTLFKEATTKGGKILQGMASEGFEEGLAEIANPLTKTIYKGTDSLKEYKDKEFWGRVGESALVGAGTSLVFGETVGRINRNTNNAREALSELKTLEIKEENLHANGKLFEGGNQQKIDKLRSKYQAELSESVSKMKEGKRAEFIKQNNLSSILNPDGSLIANTESSSLTNNSNELGVNKGLASASNKEAYSPKFFGKENSLYIQPTSQELTQENKETRLHINKLNKGYNRVGFVFVDDGAIKAKTGNNSKAIELNGTIYIERTADAESTQKVLATHEITHTLEGTKEMADYSSFVIKSILSNEVLAKKFGSVNKKFMETLDLYKGVFKQKYGDLSKLSNEDIAKVKAEIEAETLSEIIAQYTSESLFTDDAVIERLASENKSFLQKVLNWIKSKIERFKIKSKEDRQVYDFLRKAEAKFKKALESSRGGFKSIDSKAETKYNLRDNEEFGNGKERTESNKRDNSKNLGNLQGQRWEHKISSINDFRKTPERAFLESKEAREEYLSIIQSGGHTKVGMDYVGTNSFISYLEIKESLLVPALTELREENAKIGFKTKFVIGEFNKNGNKENYKYALGLYSPTYNTIYLKITPDEEISITNNHERIHNIKIIYPDFYESFKAEVKQIFGKQYENVVNLVAKDWNFSEFEDREEEFLAEFFAGGERIDLGFEIERDFLVNKYRKLLAEKAGLKELKYSLSKSNAKDSQGNTLTESQAEFFKDSKVRDENGNLLVVYHGTGNNDFTVFDITKSKSTGLLGQGFYFTKSEAEVKERYVKRNGRIISAYLNIKNPLEVDLVHKTSVISKLRDLFKGKFDIDSYVYNRKYRDGVDTKKLLDIIKKQGFDGIYNKEKGYYVAFDSNQIKEITNTRPTFSNDIRFALSKDKETNELVAIHNLSETKLLNSIELGGLAVPSIAVTKASLGHEDFGDISLIFSKNTIDPENPKNKIFSADAYSKRFPTTITKFKENTVDDLENKFRKSAELIGESLTNLETYFERESIDSIVERLRTKNYVKVQFLKDNGVEFEPIYQDYNVSGVDSKVINGLIDKFGEEVRNPGLASSEFVIEVIMPYVSDLKYNYYMEEADSFEKEGKPFANSYRKWAKDMKDSTSFAETDNYLRKAREFLKKTGTKVLAERATDEKLSSLMKGKTEEITKYLYDLLKPYDEGTYFRNNKEIFDSYGNRRDFEEIYDKVTLASIVKYMSGTVQNTEGWSYGVGNVRSLLAKQYKTLEEIREDKNKIISSEAMKNLKDQSRELYAELCLEVDPEYSDNADEILKEIAEKPYDEKSVLKVLKKYDGTNKDPEVVKHIVEFFDQLKDYPTEYFEAKPQRAVRFDEVVKVFAPKGTDERIVKFFTDKNIDIQLYGENTPTRAELIKTLPEDIKFSLSKSKRKPTYISKSKIGSENLIYLEKKLSNLYQSLEDCVADGVAIEKDNNIFVVDSGKENGIINYQIRKKIVISDEEKRKIYIKKINEESAENGFGERKLFEKLGVELDRNSRSDVRRESGFELSNNREESSNNQSRVFEEGEYSRVKYSITKGQSAKLRANYANPKVYSREDAERVVNEILGNGILELEDKFGSMKGKTKAEAIDKMFITLNKVEPGKRADLVRDMAEFVVNNATYEDIYEDDALAEQVRVYETLKEYRGKLNLDYIKDEIKHRFDNKAGGIVLQWGKQKGKVSLEIDSVAQELRELGVDISATNPADQLFEIIDLYTEARNAIKNKVDKYNIESFENSSKEKVVEEAIREIYAGLDKYGEKSKFTERVEKYTERIKQLSERIKENFNAYRSTNVVLDKVQNIKNWKMGTFLNASKYKTEAFKKSIEALSNIKFRGNINKSGTRKILTGLNSFYNKQNPILGYQEDADGATVFCYYNEEVKFMLEELSKNSNTELSVQELGYLSKVLDYFKNFLENYNKIYRNGKFVDALPIAQKHVEQLQKNKAVKVGWWSNIFNKIFNNPKASYLQTFGDPMTVARYFDKYEDGFYTEMLGKLREGAINASVLEMEIREKLDSFLEKHRDFGKSLKNRTIKYENFEIPAQKAFLLYMTLNREQAQLGLANSGFSFEDANGVIQSVDGFNKEGSTSQWEISKMAQEVRKQLESQFTDTEKEYIKIAEKIFNEDCKEAKRETDILRTGYSNVIEDYYVPIHRANIAKKIDTNLYQEIDRVSNASFNKDTKQGAQGELFINSLENVLNRHIRAVSQYAKLSTVIEEFDILYNLDILDNSNKPVNVKSESVNTWRDGYKYFKNLLSDMQGIPRGETNKIVAFLRSGFAKFQLGANPKVWATQFSSLFASSSILDYDSLVKGFAVSGKDVDNYCKLAKLRNYDNSAVLAQSVMDKVDKVGDFLMKPIGKTDRLVIKKLFGACQVQVEKNSGLKIGTEENKVKAGELLTKVILETQQNALATERSNAMRSGSEFMKAITMFTADAMKMVGRFVDGLGEYSVLRAKIKQSTDAKEIESLKVKLKKVKGKVVKSSVALTSSAVFMALIAQAFKWLYNKDKEDENIIENMVVDAFGNMLGGLPLIKDLYGKFAEGYDLNNYAYSAINDVLDSFNNLMNFDSKKPGQIVRDLVYAVGQVLGLPARNIYNITYGLTSKISPELGYKMNDLFYKQNYSSDLKKAIESNDDTMISTIVDMMLNDRVGNLNNEKAQKTISELVKKGYTVLPKNVSDTITYDGESIELTKRQKENFTKIYSQANDKVSSLTNGKDFENLPAEVKAKSIKYIYYYYYEEALKDLLGVDSDNKRYLFAQAIDIVKLAKIVAQVSQIEADTDKNGKVVSGSRKAKITQIVNSMNLTAVQKYMLMGYFGYKNANGERQVKSYIQSLKLTKTEKETLFKMCGY